MQSSRTDSEITGFLDDDNIPSWSHLLRTESLRMCVKLHVQFIKILLFVKRISSGEYIKIVSLASCSVSLIHIAI